MELRLFEYFHASTEDNDTKKVVEKMLAHSQEEQNELKELFTKNNLNIPIGFDDKDVTIEAHKTFSDRLTPKQRNQSSKELAVYDKSFNCLLL